MDRRNSRDAAPSGAPAMAASIGVVAPPAPDAAYYERDGYYAKDDPAHREASR